MKLSEKKVYMKLKYRDNTYIEEGNYYTSINCGGFKVLEVISAQKVRIVFTNTGTEKVVQGSHIRAGSIRDPYARLVVGKGYVGEGSYSQKQLKMYNCWKNMLIRCYCPDYHILYPTYMPCEVSEDWLNFQNFSGWYIKTYPKITSVRWELDKDLFSEEDKLYSENTCCWLPSQINNLLRDKVVAKGRKYLEGVFYDKDRPNGYRSHIVIDGKQKYLGTYNTQQEASDRYLEARQNNILLLAERYKNILELTTYNKLITYKLRRDV